MTAAVLWLRAGRLRLAFTPAGGLTLAFGLATAAGERPLFRPSLAVVDEPDPVQRAIGAASYVMAPFCNRIDGSAFDFDGRRWQLAPNTALSPHVIHGDVWLRHWEVLHHAADEARLQVRVADPASPYRYRIEQLLRLDDNGHTVALTLHNDGEHALPFGFGLHPHVARLGGVELQAPFARWWQVRPDGIPVEPAPALGDLDFHAPRALPARPVDTPCEGWSGQARIRWPADGVTLDIDASAAFGGCHLYQPDADAPFFCFEPVSHLTDAHHRPGLPGLVVLAPGASLSGEVRYRVGAPA